MAIAIQYEGRFFQSRECFSLPQEAIMVRIGGVIKWADRGFSRLIGNVAAASIGGYNRLVTNASCLSEPLQPIADALAGSGSCQLGKFVWSAKTNQ